MKKRNILFLTGLFCFLFIADALGGTSGNSPSGWGGRSTGMGGAGVAAVDDTAAMIYNPAAITRIKHERIDIGLGIIRGWNRVFTNDYNDKEKCSHKLYVAPQTGYICNLDDSPFTIGIGAFFTYGAGAEWEYVTPYFGGKRSSKSKVGILKLTPTIAYSMSPELSIGLCFDICYGQCMLKGVYGPAYLDIDTADNFGYGFAIGLLYEPTNRLSLGLSYTSETYLSDLKSDSASLEIAGVGLWHYDDAKIVDFQQPCDLAIGIAYYLTDHLLLGFDASWQNYSDVMKELKVKLTDGTGPDQNIVIPTGYNDVYSFYLGLDYQLTEHLSLRTGFSYDSKMIPDNRLLPLVPSVGKGYVPSIGFGYSWENYKMDVAWSRHLREEAKTKKSALISEYDNSKLEYSCDYFVLTISKVF